MDAEISLILDLQEVDLARDALLKQRSAIPAVLSAIENGLARKKALLAERRAHLEQVKKERVRREKDLDAAVSKLAGREISLKSLKSNDAYQAALKELEQSRKTNVVVEDEILNLMEEMEGVLKEVAGIEDEIRLLDNKLVAERKSMEVALGELDARIGGLEERSRALAERIDSALLADYRRARSRRGGLGLAQTAEGRCLACHMEIPPQMYNELIKGTTHHSCPSCHRILYYREEPPEVDAPAVQPGSEP